MAKSTGWRRETETMAMAGDNSGNIGAADRWRQRLAEDRRRPHGRDRQLWRGERQTQSHGDPTGPNLRGWKECLLEHSISQASSSSPTRPARNPPPTAKIHHRRHGPALYRPLLRLLHRFERQRLRSPRRSHPRAGRHRLRFRGTQDAPPLHHRLRQVRLFRHLNASGEPKETAAPKAAAKPRRGKRL